MLPIPGTTSLGHLEENWGAASLRLSADILARLDVLVNQRTIAGRRYNTATQAEIDTENFPS